MIKDAQVVRLVRKMGHAKGDLEMHSEKVVRTYLYKRKKKVFPVGMIGRPIRSSCLAKVKFVTPMDLREATSRK